MLDATFARASLDDFSTVIADSNIFFASSHNQNRAALLDVRNLDRQFIILISEGK